MESSKDSLSGLEDGAGTVCPHGGAARRMDCDVPQIRLARSPPRVLCVTSEKRLVSMCVRKPTWQRRAGWGNRVCDGIPLPGQSPEGGGRGPDPLPGRVAPSSGREVYRVAQAVGTEYIGLFRLCGQPLQRWPGGRRRLVGPGRRASQLVPVTRKEGFTLLLSPSWLGAAGPPSGVKA